MNVPQRESVGQSGRRVLAVIVSLAVLIAAAIFARPVPQTQNGSSVPSEIAAVAFTEAAGGLTAAGSSNTEAPAACVSAMVLAEQEGDVDAYLDCFAGELYEKLRSRMAGKPPEQVAAQLKSSTVNLTGFAMTDLQLTEPASATLNLERGYKVYNERQQVRLRQVSGVWKIVELKALERFAPEIPWGTPVSAPPKKSSQ